MLQITITSHNIKKMHQYSLARRCVCVVTLTDYKLTGTLCFRRRDDCHSDILRSPYVKDGNGKEYWIEVGDLVTVY